MSNHDTPYRMNSYSVRPLVVAHLETVGGVVPGPALFRVMESPSRAMMATSDLVRDGVVIRHLDDTDQIVGYSLAS